MTIYVLITEVDRRPEPSVRLFFQEAKMQAAYVEAVIADGREPDKDDYVDDASRPALATLVAMHHEPLEKQYKYALEIHGALMGLGDFPRFHTDAREVEFGDETETEPPELATILTLSTGHITQAMNSLLTEQGGVTVGVYSTPNADYGYFLTLTDEAEAVELPGADCIGNIVAYARSVGASFVRLDRDGPVVPSLPTYDW